MKKAIFTQIKWLFVAAFIIICLCIIKDPLTGYEKISQTIAFYIICGTLGFLIGGYQAGNWYEEQNDILCNEYNKLLDKQVKKEPFKLCQIRSLDSHVQKMFEGWQKQYSKYDSIWDAIENDKQNEQIGGDKGFILSVSEYTKRENPKCRLIPLCDNVPKDFEDLKQLGISIQINEYEKEGDKKVGIRVISCIIPEWMLGHTKEEILMEYEKNG
jgi:hypothetical protein